jgi:hypothetical protein
MVRAIVATRRRVRRQDGVRKNTRAKVVDACENPVDGRAIERSCA